MDTESNKRQVQIFKALGHPARLAILAVLRDGEECVCHLEAALGYRQAYISQQLAVLREAGLVEDRREGWNIFYRVSEPAIYEVIAAICHLAGETGVTGSRSSGRGKAGLACPCPKCNPVAYAGNQEVAVQGL